MKQTDEEEKQRQQEEEDLAAQAAQAETLRQTAQSLQHLQLNPNLGVTPEYNKANRDAHWDSTKAKEAYKDQTFGNKQTVRTADGTLLHKSSKAAKNKYQHGDSGAAWAHHASETDHVIPLKEIHERVKDNPFLSDQDVKEIANQKENYQLLSKRDNTSKGAKSEWQEITSPDADLSAKARLSRGAGAARAELAVDKEIALRTLRNAGGEFYSGAKTALQNAAVGLMVSAAYQVWAVGSDRKDAGEAAKDVALGAGAVAVTGGTAQLLTTAASRTAANSFLRAFAKANVATLALQAGIELAHPVGQYMDGKISSGELAEEITVRAGTLAAAWGGAEVGALVGAAAGPVGIAVGSVLGAITASIATGIIGDTILEGRALQRDYARRAAAAERLYKEAERIIKQRQAAYEQLVERELVQFDETMYQGLWTLCAGASRQGEPDYTAITAGIQKIVQYWGENVLFKDVDEYKAQLDKPLVLHF